MPIDIDQLSEAELIDLNHRIVACSNFGRTRACSNFASASA